MAHRRVAGAPGSRPLTSNGLTRERNIARSWWIFRIVNVKFITITTIGAYTRGFLFIPLAPKRDNESPPAPVQNWSASRLQGDQLAHQRVFGPVSPKDSSKGLVSEGVALLLVGHVTKDGQIAGPKVVEHMVDAVLSFEGDQGHTFRILRATKNRFGATDEIGVFEMGQKGLSEVANPSELFLGDRQSTAPGSAVFAGMEGTRPLLVEIQALVAPSSLGQPRRAVVGWDSNRLSMVLAVLAARCGVSFGQHDVYLNVAGGLKIVEPAADLAAAAALLSSYSNVAISHDKAFFGEISLSGAVRPSAHTALRLKEAQKLGFAHAVMPASGETSVGKGKFALTRINHLKELADQLAPCN